MGEAGDPATHKASVDAAGSGKREAGGGRRENYDQILHIVV